MPCSSFIRNLRYIKPRILDLYLHVSQIAWLLISILPKKSLLNSFTTSGVSNLNKCLLDYNSIIEFVIYLYISYAIIRRINMSFLLQYRNWKNCIILKFSLTPIISWSTLSITKIESMKIVYILLSSMTHALDYKQPMQAYFQTHILQIFIIFWSNIILWNCRYSYACCN